MSCCKIDVFEEIEDDLVCADFLEWRSDVSLRVWQENDQGDLAINEEARRDEIAKLAYHRWEECGTDEVSNWLEAEINVDLALFD